MNVFERAVVQAAEDWAQLREARAQGLYQEEDLQREEETLVLMISRLQESRKGPKTPAALRVSARNALLVAAGVWVPGHKSSMSWEEFEPKAVDALFAVGRRKLAMQGNVRGPDARGLRGLAGRERTRRRGLENTMSDPSDPSDPIKTHYAYQLTPLQFQALDRACRVIIDAYGSECMGCYLVGSAGRSTTGPKTYRDVDVRLILSDEGYDEYFGPTKQRLNALWSLMCMTISSWLGQQTGLPIDFQIQRMSDANRIHRGPRNALGTETSPLYPGELPSSIDADRAKVRAAES